MRKLKENNNGLIGVITIGIIFLICVGVFCIWYLQANNRYYIEGKVITKWIDYGDDTSYYLVKIEKADGTFKMLEVNRNILHGSNYNPDYVYSWIQVNHTYKFTCWGWDYEWSFIYWYPLVIIAEEI